MENFDRENIDELLEICRIRQYFSPSKICAVWYIATVVIANIWQYYRTPIDHKSIAGYN